VTCWRGLVCASLLLAGWLFWGAVGTVAAAQEPRFFRIGTAATAGSFFEIGGVIASAISSPPGAPHCAHGGGCGVPGLVAVAQTTQGSQENLRLINSGQLESGFAQADLAGWAYRGSAMFAGSAPMSQLRALASLFPESLHLVVLADSPIKSVADLRNKIVGTGEPGSGTLANSNVVLKAAGLGDDDVLRRNLRPAQAADELKTGGVDAFFIAGVYPVPAVRELAAAVPIRLVPIDGRVAEALKQEFGFYRDAVIPAGAYPGLDSETVSVGFAALWLVGADIDADLVFAIAKSLWSDQTGKMLESLNPAAQRVRLDYALKGLSVPLHPGAERFYREAGLPVDTAPQVGSERNDNANTGPSDTPHDKEPVK